MKLLFFKKKSPIVDKTEIQINKLHEEVLKKLDLLLPLSSQPIAINYVFLCENGKDGEHFAMKLAEEDNAVNYCKNGTKRYVISVTTKSIAPKEQLIKKQLLNMIERGIVFKCILTDFSIDTSK